MSAAVRAVLLSCAMICTGSSIAMASTDSPHHALSVVVEQREAQRRAAAQRAWGRDPFAGTSADQISGLTLSGIIWDATKPPAIVNGTTVGVGDVVDGFEVLAINPDVVEVSDGTTLYHLDLSP